ncbi:MAG TPA: NADH-quinone oxidoreductase subunit H [Chitinophagaceae bacterium]|nr:NADH-quinone oxidoreductase subunit H [Chitinophagaceae bacterium]
MGIPVFLLIVFPSLFFAGIILRTKSICSGRKGPSISQPLRDIWRLFQKSAVYSETASFVFQIAPAVYFATLLLAIALIPLGGRSGLISFKGDFVFFAALLSLGKFFNIIAALDTGSSLEGMGASREALYSMLAEPAFLITMASLALMTGHYSFHGIFGALRYGSSLSLAAGALAVFVLIIICLIENSRLPIDDPATHLELTMVHEVMILDNSGFDLGLISLAGSLKFAMYGALISNIIIPHGLAWFYIIPVFLALQISLAMLVGMIESFMARFRLNHNPQYIFTLTSISLLIFLGALIISGKIN